MIDERPQLVFFWSERSGPARRMESLLAHLERKERDRLRVRRVSRRGCTGGVAGRGLFRSRRWGTYDSEYLHELADEWVGRRRRTRATAVVYLSGTPLARSPRSAPPPPRPALHRSFKQPRRRASIYPIARPQKNNVE